MNKRERIERTIAGEPADRLPAACWRYLPGDDQRSADFAHALTTFQEQYDWDFLVAAPANSFLVSDYGAFDEWQGGMIGARTFIKRVVQRSLDWTTLRPLDAARGALGRVVEGIRMAGEHLADTVPLVVTVYSPLAQAADLAGDTPLMRHIRTQPERIQTGLNTLTESTVRFLEALRRMPIAGILYLIPQADYALMSEDEYSTYGLPYDRKIIDALPSKCWLNIVSFGGDLPMLKFAGGFKAQAIHWRDRETEPALSLGKTLFNGAACGGVSVRDLQLGTPNTVREAVRDAVVQMNGRRLIVTPGGFIPAGTPLSNLRALREAVEVKA
ncbi:MAG: uroporphyrinogen decarboxylase family protein [bacterium]|nr:uroporphyrinogen decarboxylase family protein [bacterium]